MTGKEKHKTLKNIDFIGPLQINEVDTTTEWTITALRSHAEIVNNQEIWLELEHNAIDPHAAFQSYTWCETWVRTFCLAGVSYPEPCIFLIHGNGVLVAILPMMLVKHRGIVGLTVLGEPHTQIANVLVRAGTNYKKGLQNCLQECAEFSGADLLSIGPIPEGTPLLETLGREAVGEDPAQCMSMITWPMIWGSEDYVKSLKKNRRKDFNHKNNRLMGLGKVSFDNLTARDAAFQELAGLALAWKKDWLAENGMYSHGLSQDGVADFIKGFSTHEGGFEPELEVLKVDGAPIAITINLVGRGYCSCYLTSYDPEYTQVAPGMLLYQYAVRGAIDDGRSGYNFLGYPTQFKEMWSTDFVPLFRYQTAITWRGKLWINVWQNNIRPRAKNLIGKMAVLRKAPLIGKFIAKRISQI